MGRIQCTEQGLLQWSVTWNCLCGDTGERRGGQKVSWSLSVGSPVGSGSVLGAPQPALPLLGHLPVHHALILVPPVLPLEEAELPQSEAEQC